VSAVLRLSKALLGQRIALLRQLILKLGEAHCRETAVGSFSFEDHPRVQLERVQIITRSLLLARLSRSSLAFGAHGSATCKTLRHLGPSLHRRVVRRSVQVRCLLLAQSVDKDGGAT